MYRSRILIAVVLTAITVTLVGCQHNRCCGPKPPPAPGCCPAPGGVPPLPPGPPAGVPAPAPVSGGF
jgi:hypothetical protein